MASPKPAWRVAGRWLVTLTTLAVLLFTTACRSDPPIADDAPVDALPSSVPTEAQIVDATTASPFIEFESTFTSIVAAKDIEVSGALDLETMQGYAERSKPSPEFGTGQATMWLAGEQLVVADDKLAGLRPILGGVFELMALGTDAPAEPSLDAALAATLRSTRALTMVGIEDLDGAAMLHLEGTRTGPLDAVVTIDIWLDGKNRLTNVTATSTLPNLDIPPAVRTLSLRYLLDAPDIPLRPALHGSQSADPVRPDRSVPTSAQIAAATASAPYIEFTTEIELGFPRLRTEGVLDVGANLGFSNSAYNETGEGFEWIESSWAENGEGFTTTDGPDSATRPANGDLETMLAELGEDQLHIDAFVVVGAESIDGEPVVHLMGSLVNVSDDETLVEVWVDADNRLVRQVTTTWQYGDVPVPAIITSTFAYPQDAPEIPPRN